MSGDKKKVIQDLPAEELLKIVTASDEPINVGQLTDAAKFVYSLNIRAGDDRISASLIYFTYKKWKGGAKPEPKWRFFKEFGRYFDRKMTNGMVYYMLNPNPFDQSEDVYWEIRREIRERREKNRREKAKKQTKQSKISGPDEKV